MRSRAIVVTALLGSSLVSGGWLLRRGMEGSAGRANISGARLYDQVRAHVQRVYVEEVPDSVIWAKSVDGMLEQLGDPHTVYLRADRLRRFEESTSGNYAGLGIQIDVRDGWIVVVAPLPGSPAERAGIESGDRVVEIEGKNTKGWTVEEARSALRGPIGAKVSLTIERPGVAARMPVSLERSDIHRSAVASALLLRDGVGYVDVNVFSERTAAELQRAIDSLRTAGMRSLVLDLRRNPGGLLDQDVGVSDLFLDSGKPIVGMRGRVADANRTFVDDERQRWPDLPIAVLIDEGSASASEIVAGALQDHDRAVVVGRASYGKGSAQTVYTLPGGGALKLTTARWYTPLGRSISRPLRGGHELEEEEENFEGDTAERKPFRTGAGRTVFGGGGIVPDVVVGDTIVPPAEAALQTALGRKVPQFRDAVTDYALALKASRAVTSRDFVVTDEMRAELWNRMRARDIEIDRAVYDSAAPVVSRIMSYEIARYVFGRQAEIDRQLAADSTVAAAVELVRGAGSQVTVFERATAHAEAARRTASAAAASPTGRR